MPCTSGDLICVSVISVGVSLFLAIAIQNVRLILGEACVQHPLSPGFFSIRYKNKIPAHTLRGDCSGEWAFIPQAYKPCLQTPEWYNAVIVVLFLIAIFIFFKQKYQGKSESNARHFLQLMIKIKT